MTKLVTKIEKEQDGKTIQILMTVHLNVSTETKQNILLRIKAKKFTSSLGKGNFNASTGWID